jgi:hypothetical protein
MKNPVNIQIPTDQVRAVRQELIRIVFDENRSEDERRDAMQEIFQSRAGNKRKTGTRYASAGSDRQKRAVTCGK